MKFTKAKIKKIRNIMRNGINQACYAENIECPNLRATRIKQISSTMAALILDEVCISTLGYNRK